MSFDVATRVWEQSKMRGTAKLLLLALAERADDDGVSWPGIKELTWRCQCNERRIQQIMAEAESLGELFAPPAVGRGNHQKYFVTVGLSPETIKNVLVKEFKLSPDDAQKRADEIGEKVQSVAPFKGAEKVQRSAPIKAEKVQRSAPFNGDKRCNPRQEKVQSLAVKGAIPDTPYKDEPPIEPPIEPPEEERASAPPSSSPSFFRPEKTRPNDLTKTPVYQALKAVCKITVLTPSPLQQQSLHDTTRALAEVDATAEQVEVFGRNWRTFWKGKNGEPPRPVDVWENWGALSVETASIASATGLDWAAAQKRMGVKSHVGT